MRSALILLAGLASLATACGTGTGTGNGNGGGGTPVTDSTWSSTATDFRGKNGSRYTYTCTPGGTVGSVWGTGVYTDDSSVCTAAVHAGLITLAAGGTVTIEIRAGQDAYVGSTQHGVTSSDYGSWDGSYVFP